MHSETRSRAVNTYWDDFAANIFFPVELKLLQLNFVAMDAINTFTQPASDQIIHKRLHILKHGAQTLI